MGILLPSRIRNYYNYGYRGFSQYTKSLYSQRRQTRKVDHLLYILIKIARDQIFEVLIKVEKGIRTHKLRELDSRHGKGKAIDAKDVWEAVGEGKWEVRSQEDKANVYSVERKLQTCNYLVCSSKCGVCQHIYSCSCVDHTIRSTARESCSKY